jgi:hypothetical protein
MEKNTECSVIDYDDVKLVDGGIRLVRNVSGHLRDYRVS